MRINLSPSVVLSRLVAVVLAVISTLLAVSSVPASEPHLKDVRTQKVGETVYFEATIEATDVVDLLSRATQESASSELARRQLMQLPRLVPQDGRTTAVSVLSLRPGSVADAGTLKFIGKRHGGGTASLRLFYPTGTTSVAPKGSLLEPYLQASTWAEAVVTIDFQKARRLDPPARNARRGQRRTTAELKRTNVDLEALWASAQARSLAVLEMQSPGFGFYGFAREATGRKYLVTSDPLGPPPVAPDQEVHQRLYALTTGGAALAESLAQRRLLPARTEQHARRSRDIQDVPGITIREHPWERMMGDKEPAAEPLAKLVPHDNYYATAHGLGAYLQLAELLDQWGGNVLHASELNSRDEQVRARYERQLCLPAARLAPKLGFTLVRDLAITGSDLYWREGSDVSVLFHVTDRKRFLEAVEPFLREARKEFGDALKVERTEYGGVRIESFVAPLGEVRLHRAAVGDVVIYSNSPVALRRILNTRAGRIRSLADALDFRYMRTIFRRDDKQEDGFAFLSDAFLRTMVSPASKIKEQRRLQALASLTLTHHAALFHAWETGRLPANQKELKAGAALDDEALRDPEGDEVTWDPERRVAVSKIYGTRHFLTPLLELAIDRITDQEQRDYLQFQGEYNRLWQRYFDPAGLRLSVRGQKLDVETYILPLLQNEEYQFLRMLTDGGTTTLDLRTITPRSLAQLTINPGPLLQFIHPNNLQGAAKQIFLRLEDGPAYRRLLELAVRREFDRQTDEEVGAEIVALLPQLPITLGIEIGEEKAFEALQKHVLPNEGDAEAEILKPAYKGVAITRLPATGLPAGGKSPPFLYHAKVRGMWYACFHLDSLRRAIDHTLTREAKKADDNLTINCSLYVAPRALLQAAGPVHDYLEWHSQRRALDNGTVWYALQRCGLITSETTASERGAIALRQLGFVPISPEGAAYRYAADSDEMVNERHGSYRRPRLRDGMEGGSAGRQLLGLLRSLHVGLRFREDGIHTTLTFDRSTDADKRSALDPAHLAIVKRGGWVELDESRPGHPIARVNLAGSSIGDTDLAELRNIKHLHTLILDEAAITDAGLKQLRDLTELRELRIDTPGVSDAGARALADAIKGLTIVRRTDKERFLDELRLVGGKSDGEEVDLAGTQINDTWLMQLRTLPNLTKLNLARTAVTDAGLAHLKQWQQLRALDLDNTAVSDDGLKHLKGLRNLESLSLCQTRIHGEGLAHLQDLPRLHDLALQDTAITDANLKYLYGLKRLRVLRIDTPGVSDAGVRDLAGARKGLTIFRRTDKERFLDEIRALGGKTNGEEVDLAGTKISDAWLKRMTVLPELDRLNLGSTSVTDAGLEHLRQHKQLRHLLLRSTTVTDSGLEHLKALDRLEYLDLSRTQVRGEGLAHLKGLTRLRRLDLDDTPITNADLRHLGGLKGLRTLHIDTSGVSDAGAASLKEALRELSIMRRSDLDRLREEIRQLGVTIEKGSVNLSGRAIDEDLLAKMKRLPDLRHLNLSGANSRSGGLKPLRDLTQLRELDLRRTDITDADLEPLGSMIGLETLYLDGTKIRGEGLTHLKDLPKLHRLGLKKVSIDDTGLTFLKDLKRLRWLNLDGTAITDAGVKHLRGLTELRELYLDADAVSDAGANEVKTILPGVAITRTTDPERVLAIIQKTGGRGDGQEVRLTSARYDAALLPRLKVLPELRRLDLRDTSLSDDSLAHLKDLKRLHALNISQTGITDAGLAHLEGLTDLRTLDLTGTKVGNAGLKHLHGLKSLRRICLEETLVTDEGAAQLRAALPDLKAVVRRTDQQIALSGLVRTTARLRGRVELDDRGPGQPQVKVIFYAAEITNAQLAGLRGLSVVHHLRLSGERKVGDAGLAGLKGATNLRTLDLSRTAITDGGLEHLKDLTNLRGIYLADTRVQGAGLSHLKGLKKLQRLDLGNTGVGDKALAQLKGLTQLRELSLDFTQVSDASLDCLTGMTRLEKVNVRGTRMTPAGLAALRRALPQAVILGD